MDHFAHQGVTEHVTGIRGSGKAPGSFGRSPLSGLPGRPAGPRPRPRPAGRRRSAPRRPTRHGGPPEWVPRRRRPAPAGRRAGATGARRWSSRATRRGSARRRTGCLRTAPSFGRPGRDPGRVQLIGHQREQVRPLEPGQVDAVGALAALELREVRDERPGRVGFVRSDGRDEEHPLVAQVPDEERHEVARGRVGPMQVLDDDRDRRQAGESLEHTEDELEQADLREAVLRRRRNGTTSPGSHRRPPDGGPRPRRPRASAARAPPDPVKQRRARAGIDVSQEDADRLDEGAVRQATRPKGQAAPDQDPTSVRTDRGRERLDEPCLADARFAREDDRPRFAGTARA